MEEQEVEEREGEAGTGGEVPPEGAKAAVSTDPFEVEVLAELERLEEGKGSGSQAIVILLVTLAIFFGVDLAGNKLLDVLIIIGVLLVHEMGHYVAMRLFGYRDVQMFFIPGFGAAVAGKSLTAPGWKRAVVSLMGPVPGIFLGLAVAVAWLVTKSDLLGQVALVLVVVNGFNLLPIFPLDGGRFAFEVLLRRSRVLEVVVRLGAALVLTGGAFALGDWLLGVIALSLFFSLGPTWHVATATQRLQMDGTVTPAQGTGDLSSEEKLRILRVFHQEAPEMTQPKVVASWVWNVWQRLCTTPPGCLASAALLAVYGFTFVSLVVSPFVAMGFSREVKTEVCRLADGTEGKKAVGHSLGRPHFECTLDEKGLYHGPYERWWALGEKKVEARGEFRHGRRGGTWKYWDQDGKLVREEVYGEGGRITTRREREGSEWVDRPMEEASVLERTAYEQSLSDPPLGPPKWP